MGFQQGEVWIYDPHSIISIRRTNLGSVPYFHQSKPQLELLENHDSLGGCSENFAGSGITFNPTITFTYNKDSNNLKIHIREKV
jgi:hypothetical protein